MLLVSFVTPAGVPRADQIASQADRPLAVLTANPIVPVLGALQVQTETQPLASIVYGYDPLGRLASRQVSGNGPEGFGYDELNRLTSHSLGSFTLGYNGDSGQITSRASTKVDTTWAYLPNAMDRRLASIDTTWLAAGQFTQFQYCLNIPNLSASCVNPVNQDVEAGTDAENQILAMTQTSDAVIPAPPTSVSNQTAVYDNNPLNELNPLTIGTGAPATLTWNKLGNLAADATRTYAWDGENRLVNVSYPAGTTYDATSFTYDGLGRRTSISLTPTGGGSAVTTNYVWCGDQLCQARNAAGALIRAYYAEGEYVSGSPATSLYYACDNLGSVRRVFGKNQASAYDYDGWGNLLQSPTTVVTDFTWAGMFNEPNSGLYLTNYRPYDPVTGRFITRDPAGETADPEGNLYPYAANDPVNANDPLGLCPETDGEEKSWDGSNSKGAPPEEDAILPSDKEESPPPPPPTYRATFGEAVRNDYTRTFFLTFPSLAGLVVVHHAVPQNALKLGRICRRLAGGGLR